MNKNEIQDAVNGVFRALMQDRGTAVEHVDEQRVLYAEGYGLDSMDTATLSAMLSDRFDDDPYIGGVFPQTLSEISSYYDGRLTR